MKWFNVSFEAFAEVLVQAESGDDAYARAFEEADRARFEITGGTATEVPVDELGTYRRHATTILDP